MAERVGRGADQFVVRLPDGMRERIAEQAKANNRSMNAEIVARLEWTFGETERFSEMGMTAISQRLEATAQLMELLMQGLYADRVDALVEEKRRAGIDISVKEARQEVLMDRWSQQLAEARSANKSAPNPPVDNKLISPAPRGNKLIGEGR